MERIYTEPSALRNISKAIIAKQNNTSAFEKKLNLKVKAFPGLRLLAKTKASSITKKGNSIFAKHKLLIPAKATTLVVIFLLTLGSSTRLFGQNIWTGNTNANWGTSSNWSLNRVPENTDNVLIYNNPAGNNDDPIVDVVAVCASLTILGGNKPCKLSISGTNSLNISGTITIESGTSNNAHKIIDVATGSMSCSSITMTNTGDNNRYSRVTISTGTVTVSGNISMFASSPSFPLRNQIYFTGAGTLNVGGSISGGDIVSSIGSTVNYNGSVNAQTVAINTDYIYYNLHLNNTSGATLQAAITTTNVIGNIKVQSGSFDNSGFQIAGSSGQTFSVENNAIFYVSGTTSFPSGFGTYSLGTASTVEYNGTGAQTIATQNYGNLIISGSRTSNSVTLANVGNIGIAEIFSPTATFSTGSYVIANNTISFNGIGDQTIPSFTYNNLTIPGSPTNGIKTIAYNGQVTVDGLLTNSLTTANFVIKSSSSGTGSLLTKGTITGTATVERYISNDFKWHFLSSPVVAQDIWPNFATTPTSGSFGTPPLSFNFYYYNPNALTATQLYWVSLFDVDGLYNSGGVDISGNAAGFGSLTPTPVITPGRGYLVTYGSEWPDLHTFSGTLNAGSISTPLKAGVNPQSYNLVGNPYPSSIDWSNAATGWDRTDLLLNGSGYDYWIWNDNPSVGNYAAFNSADAEGSGADGADRYIAPQQAFFVQAAGDGTLGMTNTIRAHSGQAWLKSTNSITADFLKLKLTSTATTYSDEMVVSFDPSFSGGGTEKFWSFYSEAPALYSFKDGRNLCIDRYSSIEEDLEINVNAKIGVSGPYTITASNINDFILSSKVLLLDKKTNITTNLKQTSSYNFVGDISDVQNRFLLLIGSPLGINDPIKSSFNIYNLENVIYVQNDKTNEPYFVTVSNILGQTLVRTDFTGNSLNRIEMQNVPGVYVVHVVSNGKTYSQKVVIR